MRFPNILSIHSTQQGCGLPKDRCIKKIPGLPPTFGTCRINCLFIYIFASTCNIHCTHIRHTIHVYCLYHHKQVASFAIWLADSAIKEPPSPKSQHLGLPKRHKIQRWQPPASKRCRRSTEASNKTKLSIEYRQPKKYNVYKLYKYSHV